MIHIEHNQTVPEHDNLRVLSASGDYADNDLIECSTLDDPNFALCAFSATFIRYGGLAHQFSDPLKLGEALLALDPKSTHDAVTLFKEEEARRIKREGGDFTPENPVPADEAVSQIAQEEVRQEDVQEKTEDTKAQTKENDPQINTPAQDQSNSTSTNPQGGEVLGEVTQPSESSTSTPITQTPPQEPAPEPTPETPVVETMQGPVETLIESISNGLSQQE
jgi:hypothetical protein